MSGFSPQGIFISYRREEAAAYARVLKVALKGRFPDAKVFMDVDSIEAGLDFREEIREAVGSCAVLVALVSPQWATLKGKRGPRRLDDPDDFVRFELSTALDRHVPVIPVLVDGARPLRRPELPSELQRLARLQALELSLDDRYQYDADRLFNVIQLALIVPGGTGRLPGLEWRVRVAEQVEDAAGACAIYAELAREQERVSGPDDPATLAARANVARMTAAAGNAAGAREQYDALLPLCERVLGREHPDTLAVRLGRAHATYETEGELYPARGMYLELLSDSQSFLGDDHPLTREAAQSANIASLRIREARNLTGRGYDANAAAAANRIEWFKFKH